MANVVASIVESASLVSSQQSVSGLLSSIVSISTASENFAAVLSLLAGGTAQASVYEESFTAASRNAGILETVVSADFSDAVARRFDSATETISPASTSSAVRGAVAAVSENSTAGDFSTKRSDLLAYQQDFGDANSLHTVTVAYSVVFTYPETVVPTDASFGSKNYIASWSDAVSPSEISYASSVILSSGVETVSATAVQTVLVWYHVQFDELAQANSVQTVRVDYLQQKTENANASDSIFGSHGISTGVSEASFTTDSSVPSQGRSVSQSESTTVSSSQTVVVKYLVSVQETVSATDGIARTGGYPYHHGEQVSASTIQQSLSARLGSVVEQSSTVELVTGSKDYPATNTESVSATSVSAGSTGVSAFIEEPCYASDDGVARSDAVASLVEAVTAVSVDSILAMYYAYYFEAVTATAYAVRKASTESAETIRTLYVLEEEGN